MEVGPYTLRRLQVEAVDKLRAAVSACRRRGVPARVLLVAPCGFGKTLVSSAMMLACQEKGRTSGFVANRRQLVYQKTRKLTECGIEHAVLMAGEDFDRYSVRCLVASKDTLWARRDNDSPIPERDLWIVDEAHEGMNNTLSIVKDGDVVIGLTATPVLSSGRGMGEFYNELVIGATYEELLRERLLVPCRVFAAAAPDLSGLRKQDGDWSWDAVGARMDKPVLVGDVVKEWKEKGEGRPTAVFACNVEHSLHLRDAFIDAGVEAAHIDAETCQAEREDVFSALESGCTKVVCNVGVVTTGVDLPFLSCLSMAFASASLGKVLQVAGRVLRICDGKQDAIIIDHGGNIYRHGWPTEDHEWKLNPDSTVEEWDKEAERKAKQQEMIACSACGALRRGGAKCPHCGHGHVRSGQSVLFEDGHLEEIEHKQKAKEVADGEKLWKQCLGVAAHRNGSVTMARVMYQQKSGHWPDQWDITPRNKQSCKVADLYPGFRRRRSA